MPHYFLHLRGGSEEIVDPGRVIVAPVAALAFSSARGCIAGDVAKGCIDLRYWMDVHDENGCPLHAFCRRR
ncbi:hypothetical protein G7076_00055 [Sphingomonas sp. HDW15A]|uniref:hypothetical protein n=1 Tax=Sphingomonas sp. HDW15A TaxID=2714942 RepID=UPI00140D4974|nr:hypothetical protein [Sphingomonas sp. HDW15A]QIK95094.1 hypothetical protein G7076_00055 [Sphingomonas sp. HDW15A]